MSEGRLDRTGENRGQIFRDRGIRGVSLADIRQNRQLARCIEMVLPTTPTTP